MERLPQLEKKTTRQILGLIMNTPTPPPGYKLVKGIDIKDQVPEGAMVYDTEHWFKSAFCNEMLPPVNHDDFYAIPSSPVSIEDPYQVQIGGVRCDPYRIARAYGISDPVIFQALKKLLRFGRKHKDRETDVREAITSLERWEQMNKEDSK